MLPYGALLAHVQMWAAILTTARGVSNRDSSVTAAASDERWDTLPHFFGFVRKCEHTRGPIAPFRACVIPLFLVLRRLRAGPNPIFLFLLLLLLILVV
jgi:hypothetical protein